MPRRMAICGNCGEKISLPKSSTPKAKIKCSNTNCEAIAELKVRRRNNRVKGLKGGFLQKIYIHLR